MQSKISDQVWERWEARERMIDETIESNVSMYRSLYRSLMTAIATILLLTILSITMKIYLPYASTDFFSSLSIALLLTIT